MNLYLVHCGFYDSALCDGLYESHVNFFIAASSFEEAKSKAKELVEFKTKKMHIDGLQEIQVVQGYNVELKHSIEHKEKTIIISNKHRDLAPKTNPKEAL